MSLLSNIHRFLAPPALPKPGTLPPRRYSESELLAFEQCMDIRLPQAYRDFMKETGGGDKVSLLEEWCQPEPEEEMPPGFLQSLFPHQAAWNEVELRQGKSDWDTPYHAHELFQGSMRIVNTGCEGYHLLVVSGLEAGNLWHDDRVCCGQGIYPLVSPSGGRLGFAEYLTLPALYPFPAPA